MAPRGAGAGFIGGNSIAGMTPTRRVVVAVATLSIGLALAGCASQTPLAMPGPVLAGPAASPRASAATGNLLVYSATYAATLEQSEYPVHTNYTIATTDGHVVRRVTNLAGPFFSYPAKVTLPVGDYHVRAQFEDGGFVIVPVSIAPGEVTIVDLDREPLPADTAATRRPVYLPSGRLVGWLATSRGG